MNGAASPRKDATAALRTKRYFAAAAPMSAFDQNQACLRLPSIVYFALVAGLPIVFVDSENCRKG